MKMTQTQNKSKKKYNKVSSQTVGVLKQEVLNFIDLMKSLDKEVSQQQVEQNLEYKIIHQ